jgi:hypothetical protein
VAIAGPLITVALTAAFTGLTALGHVSGWAPAVVGVTDYLARINALVLAFNLASVLSPDGGRVLHAEAPERRSGHRIAEIMAPRARGADGRPGHRDVRRAASSGAGGHRWRRGAEGSGRRVGLVRTQRGGCR